MGTISRLLQKAQLISINVWEYQPGTYSLPLLGVGSLRRNTRAICLTKASESVCFLKKLIFIWLGPNAGPDGLIPWTRFCKVGTVWVFCALGSRCLLRFSCSLLWWLLIFVLILAYLSLARGNPRAGCLLSFSAEGQSPSVSLTGSACACDNILSIWNESSVYPHRSLAWQRFRPIHEKCVLCADSDSPLGPLSLLKQRDHLEGIIRPHWGHQTMLTGSRYWILLVGGQLLFCDSPWRSFPGWFTIVQRGKQSLALERESLVSACP